VEVQENVGDLGACSFYSRCHWKHGKSIPRCLASIADLFYCPWCSRQSNMAL